MDPVRVFAATPLSESNIYWIIMLLQSSSSATSARPLRYCSIEPCNTNTPPGEWSVICRPACLSARPWSHIVVVGFHVRAFRCNSAVFRPSFLPSRPVLANNNNNNRPDPHLPSTSIQPLAHRSGGSLFAYELIKQQQLEGVTTTTAAAV